jgi:hypothetical protein
MVRRSTWFALILLAALIGFAIYLKQKPESPAGEEGLTATPQSQSLFGSEAGQPDSILISSSAGETVELALGADKTWALKQPVEAAADQGQAQAAATQIGAIENLGVVDAPLDAVGLAPPAYTITLGFAGGARHTLEVGDQTPSGTGYYLRMDGGKVVIASGAESLLELLTAPPYQETPTPSPEPATATPTVRAATGTPATGPATPTP